MGGMELAHYSHLSAATLFYFIRQKELWANNMNETNGLCKYDLLRIEGRMHVLVLCWIPVPPLII